MGAPESCENGAAGVACDVNQHGETPTVPIVSPSEPVLTPEEHHVVEFDDANDENEDAPLLQHSDTPNASLPFDPLKTKASGSGLGSDAKVTGECRICQESDPVDQLEKPCACSGSMLYAHKACIQHWINEKGDTTCEICHKPFQGDYDPPRPPFTGFVMPPLGVFDASRLHEAAAAVAERMAAEAEEERVTVYAHYPRFLCLRLTIVFILSLFLLRIFFTVTNEDAESQADAPSGMWQFIVLIRLIGPLIPFILMYQAIVSVRRQQLNVQNALTRADVAWLLRDAQNREPHVLRIHTLSRAV